jgi:hypothetical protein
MDRSKERKYLRSIAKSRFLTPSTPNVLATIEMQEQCSLCENAIPDGRAVLRNDYTHNIICVFCVIRIAEMDDE